MVHLLTARVPLCDKRCALVRRAYTLVEILVVIAIIGVLVSLVLPAIQHARDAARRMTCSNNLRQLGIAMHNFEGANQHLPVGYQFMPSPRGNQLGHSWAAYLLPFFEQDALQARIDFNKPVYHPANQAVRETHLSMLICPNDSVSPSGFVEMGPERFAMASYVANFGTPDLDDDQAQSRGPWGPFYRNSKTQIAEIKDGLSHTLMVGERQNGPFRTANSHGFHVNYETTWIGAVRDIDEPTDDHGHMALFQTGHTPNHPMSDDRDVSASHRGQALFLMCDGSVTPVSEDVSPTTYTAYGTMNGAEVNGAEISRADD